MLTIGMNHKETMFVDQTKTAACLASGELAVFATPAMIALMEYTSSECVKQALLATQSTVGTAVNIKHLSATPMGHTVWCESELVEIDRRRLVFRVAAYDAAGLIGEGMHERFIVDKEQFMNKVHTKGVVS